MNSLGVFHSIFDMGNKQASLNTEENSYDTDHYGHQVIYSNIMLTYFLRVGTVRHNKMRNAKHFRFHPSWLKTPLQCMLSCIPSTYDEQISGH